MFTELIDFEREFFAIGLAHDLRVEVYLELIAFRCLNLGKQTVNDRFVEDNG